MYMLSELNSSHFYLLHLIFYHYNQLSQNLFDYHYKIMCFYLYIYTRIQNHL
nr:MAG TPA: hypothetical protein [Bacteriophage sp.]